MPRIGSPAGITRRRSRQSGRDAQASRVASSARARDAIGDMLAQVRIALTPVQIYGLTLSSNQEGLVKLAGAVRTDRACQRAERLAGLVPGVQKVVSQLVVDTLAGSMPVQRTVTSPEFAAEVELNQVHVASGTEDRLNDMVGTTDTAIATDETEPFFAPTDPPTRRAPRVEGGYTVVGGFSPTALDGPIDLEQLPRALTLGDDEIARRVRLALKEDAITSDLPINVVVRGGVVHLRGAVQSLADSDVAEEVAARVPGVVEVDEGLDVVGF